MSNWRRRKTEEHGEHELGFGEPHLDWLSLQTAVPADDRHLFSALFNEREPRCGGLNRA
jgi:hypothetical protein